MSPASASVSPTGSIAHRPSAATWRWRYGRRSGGPTASIIGRTPSLGWSSAASGGQDDRAARPTGLRRRLRLPDLAGARHPDGAHGPRPGARGVGYTVAGAKAGGVQG